MMVLLVLVLVAAAFGFLGRFVALQKRRDPGEGLLLGALFGPLGVLVEALLPTLEPPKRKPARRMPRSGWQPPPDDADEDDAFRFLTDRSKN